MTETENNTLYTNNIYVAIDLKSFYASVECIERGLDPLDTLLVVADPSRSEKTICLAVTPALKAYGVSGRSRLFEVVQKVKVENAKRTQKAQGIPLKDRSYFAEDLKHFPHKSIDYIVAPPRMALYIDYSTKIYEVYLKYVAPEDIHVYSIDEVFMDITHYLKRTNLTPREFTKVIIKDVLESVGITATAGIGSNLYLCKVAMDIMAKKIEPDADGVRIAELDEYSYRRLLWDHQPITDFWRVGKGYAKKLESHDLYTMGDVARCSIGDDHAFHNEDLLYSIFGINAELLIDHAWGWEPCKIEHVKAYKPSTSSTAAGQVLLRPYEHEETRVVVKEMVDQLVLDLVDKNLVTDQIVLTVGFDISNLSDPEKAKSYKGQIKTDYYGRKVPKHAHGTANLKDLTSSTKLIMEAALALYDDIVDKSLFVRRITIGANHVVDKDFALNEENMRFEQLDLFTEYDQKAIKDEDEKATLEKEKRLQQALIDVKKKFGKNSVLKGLNFRNGATGKDRNNQIGGHKAN